MSQKSLLDQFENIETLRAEQLTAVGSVRGGITRRINHLLRLEGVIESIIESIDRQRVRRDEIDVTINIPFLSPSRRQDHLAKSRTTVSNYMQRAFSLPVDIREPRKDVEIDEKQLIQSVVIQPEYIPDSFMVELGFMTEEEERSLPYCKKVERKIQTIEQIKSIFANAIPLALGEKRKTGRILLIKNPGNANHGKYIIFQETTNIDQESPSSRRKVERRVLPRIYESSYHIIRSQKYAIRALSDRINLLRSIRDTDLYNVLLNWKEDDYTEGMKRLDIGLILEKLEKKVSFHERKAVEDRIKKINYRHPEQDFQRLNGATRDIDTATRIKISQCSEIRSQLSWIENLESKERGNFEVFYTRILSLLEIMNQDPSTESLTQEGIEAGTTIDSHSKNHIGKIWSTIRKYLYELRDSNIHELGYPYLSIAGTIVDHETRLKKCLDESGGRINAEYLRITLSLILELKRIAYTIIILRTEHFIKLYKGKLPYGFKKSMKEKLQAMRYGLIEVRFLPMISLKKRGHEVFEDMVQTIDELILEIEKY